MRLLFALGLLQRGKLALGQNQAFLGDFGLERFEPFLHRLIADRRMFVAELDAQTERPLILVPSIAKAKYLAPGANLFKFKLGTMLAS